MGTDINTPLRLLRRDGDLADGGRLQIQLPGLPDKVLSEAVMLFFGHEAEAEDVVDPSRGRKDAVRPEGYLPVAGFPRKRHAFLRETPPQTQAARLRLDQEQPELCQSVSPVHKEYAADRLSVHLG